MNLKKNNFFKNLDRKIKTNKFKVGVVGLGYVGLNLLYLFSKNKINVFGFDKDLKRINQIKNRKSYLSDLENKDLKHINPKNLFHSVLYQNISDLDIIIITVPTPLNKNKTPDLKAIEDVIHKIKKYLKKDQLVYNDHLFLVPA